MKIGQEMANHQNSISEKNVWMMMIYVVKHFFWDTVFRLLTLTARHFWVSWVRKKLYTSKESPLTCYFSKSLINKFEFFFSEDQGRYIIEVSKKNLKKIENILKENSVHFDNLGEVQKDNYINIDSEKISVDELSKHNKNWLMEYMAQ